jgi:hypothetical protein
MDGKDEILETAPQMIQSLRAIMPCSALLFAVRWHHPSVRLNGNGFIAVLIGFRPRRRANPIWFCYGAVSLVAGTLNAMTVNSLVP